jgi:hypothetical protein
MLGRYREGVGRSSKRDSDGDGTGAGMGMGSVIPERADLSGGVD